MKVTLLGTGDAIGTPVVGCNCPACIDGKNGGRSRRYRFSVMVESQEGKRVLVDTGPDLKWQMLENEFSHVDGVIWTHGHYDHYAGFVEFHRIQRKVDVYGLTQTLDYILDYLYFLKPVRHDVSMYEQFYVGDLGFTLFEVNHPPMENVAGVMICEGNKKVVITGDTCKDIPQRSMSLIRNADLLVADAIVPSGFNVKKHMNSQQALKFAEDTGAKDVVLIHLSHYFRPHDEEAEDLPLGYDGMEIEIL